jgi:hypothetical protein
VIASLAPTVVAAAQCKGAWSSRMPSAGGALPGMTVFRELVFFSKTGEGAWRVEHHEAY